MSRRDQGIYPASRDLLTFHSLRSFLYIYIYIHTHTHTVRSLPKCAHAKRRNIEARLTSSVATTISPQVYYGPLERARHGAALFIFTRALDCDQTWWVCIGNIAYTTLGAHTALVYIICVYKARVLLYGYRWTCMYTAQDSRCTVCIYRGQGGRERSRVDDRWRVGNRRRTWYRRALAILRALSLSPMIYGVKLRSKSRPLILHTYLYVQLLE